MNITNPRSIAWQLLSLKGKRAAMSGFAEGETHLQRRLHAEYRATPRVPPEFVLRVCGGRRLHELHLPRRAASRPQAEVQRPDSSRKNVVGGLQFAGNGSTSASTTQFRHSIVWQSIGTISQHDVTRHKLPVRSHLYRASHSDRPPAVWVSVWEGQELPVPPPVAQADPELMPMASVTVKMLTSTRDCRSH
jgi:hypothetical protein